MNYSDYISRLNVQDILAYAGYKLNRRDGLKYPCFVRIDENGRRVRGDKFIVTQQGKCCFHPPEIKSYNIISLIKNHPEMFPESASGINGDRLVNAVCRRILNMPVEDRLPDEVRNARAEAKPFNLADYAITKFNAHDQRNREMFDAYFKHRGISIMTQNSFRKSFCIATHEKKSPDGKGRRKVSNLSFPLVIPGKKDVVGFEQRGRPFLNGKSFKGKAQGSNGSEGLWIASPENTKLNEAKRVFVFESAYDAMAFYQILTGKDSNLDKKDRQELHSAVFVSTGGSPTYNQMSGLIREASNATFHLAFDNDMAGKQFEKNFRNIAYLSSPVHPRTVPPDMRPFIESFNDEIKSTDTLKNIGEDQYDALPEDLKKLYLKYDRAYHEAMEAHCSPFLCKEDKEDAASKSHAVFVTFKTALFQRLNIKEGQPLEVKMVREEPSEGYKDWNEELLGEQQEQSETQSKGGSVKTKLFTGVDMDGDGENDIIDKEQQIDDKKQKQANANTHAHHARHH